MSPQEGHTVFGAKTGAVLVPILIVTTACTTIFRSEQQGDAARGRVTFQQGDLGAPYQTGVPYAYFIALMDRYPTVLARDWEDIRARYGLLEGAQTPKALPLGFALRADFLTGTPFLMTNCALCHQGEIAGRRIEGIGNRNLRLNAMDNALSEIGSRSDFTADAMVAAARAAAKREGISWSWRSDVAAREATKKIREISSGHTTLDAGPGRNTPIEFAKAACKVPVAAPHGFVKFPAVWMFKKRESFGFDGSLTGELWLTSSSVEFNKGMSSRTILAQPGTWRDLYAYLSSLESPPFPKSIDSDLAGRGHRLYVESCARCHGTVGASYVEKIVPQEIVGTDPDRLNAVTDDLVQARNKTPIGARTPLVKQDGYVAPPLDGIWARAPYLHNGSVPTLRDLLLAPGERPTGFPVGSGTGYDLDNVGLASTREPGPSSAAYDFTTTSAGGSNAGHIFGTRLPDEDKRALLEFLKTL
jgi:hypothetical protein